MKLLSARAFTLIETLVALAIMAVIVVVSIASLPQFLGARSLDAAVSDTISLLEEARQLTLASKDPDPNDGIIEGSQYGVYFSTATSPHSATLFSGSSFNPASPGNAKKTIQYSGVEISQINFANTALKNSVVFNRLTGATNNGGSITFRDKRTGKQKGVSVADQGNISTGNNLTQLGWTKKKTITLNNPTSSSLQNFPVLIRLSEPKIEYDDFLSTNDYDLQFLDADDATILDYEIEKWDPAGESIVWVRVPTLQSGTDTIYMYYGKSDIANTLENKTKVWDSNYVAVWHLKDYKDSTAYGHHGIEGSGQSNALQAMGIIGYAQEFSGTQKIKVANTSALKIIGDLAIELWFNSDKNEGPYTYGILLKNYGCYIYNCDGYGLGFLPTGTDINGTTFTRSMAGYLSDGGDPWSPFGNNTYKKDTDTFLALRRSANTVHMQKYDADSALEASLPITGVTYNQPNGANLYLGMLSDNDTSLWVYDGIIDEVRISNVARSSDWIKASYENQKSGSTFVTIE